MSVDLRIFSRLPLLCTAYISQSCALRRVTQEKEMVEIVLTLGLICGIVAGVMICGSLLTIASGRLIGH